MHHTKTKGDLGVLKVMTDLCSKGYLVLVPMTEHASFDLVAYRGNIFQRIQVKYRSLRNGKLEVSSRTSWADKHGTHINQYTADAFDIFALYCPNTDKCYYVKWDGIFDHLYLRIMPSKNNQIKGIHLATDYEEVPWPRSSVGLEHLASTQIVGSSSLSEVANLNIAIH